MCKLGKASVNQLLLESTLLMRWWGRGFSQINQKNIERKMLSVSSEERHFWSLVVSLMNNTSHHTKDTPVIAQKIYEKTTSSTSSSSLYLFRFCSKCQIFRGSIHLEIRLTKRNICLMHSMSGCWYNRSLRAYASLLQGLKHPPHNSHRTSHSHAFACLKNTILSSFQTDTISLIYSLILALTN